MSAKGEIMVRASRLDDVAAVKAETRRISFIKCDIESEELAFSREPRARSWSMNRSS